MKKERILDIIKNVLLALSIVLGILGLLIDYIPQSILRYCLLVLCAVFFIMVNIRDWLKKRQLSEFANDICETVDALMEEREPESFKPYEDTSVSKVQVKLLQYYDKMKDGQLQSEQNRQTIQELVSDISHQVKTPIANIRMFTNILQEHELSVDKRNEFLNTMYSQINKLDFLMQSLIKMSRLETGTFNLHMEEDSLYNTIAQAVSGIFTKAENKNIELDVQCDSKITVKHDSKWTVEALGNILDNAVKYTPENGNIYVSVRPWQFYTRIDIMDTGIGISAGHYNDVFKRFYRGEEVAAKEGVGLGLYLARGIINRQKGYITVKSEKGKGTTFSVFLLS